MTRFSCAEVLDHVDALVRDELATGLRARVEEHLAGCSDCREAREAAELARGTFARVETPGCPDDVVARIWATLDEETAPSVAVATPVATASGPETTTGLGARLRAWLAPARLVPTLTALATLLLLLGPWSRVEEPRGIPDSVLAGLPAHVVAAIPEEMLASMTESELREMVAEAELAFAIVADAIQRSTRVAGDEMRYGLTLPVMQGVSRSVHHLPPPLQEKTSS